MGFPIPEPFAWDHSFRTFYNAVDDEHKSLFNGVFQLGQNDNVDNLAEMRRCTGKHFLNEQRLMQGSQYPKLEAHTKAHNDFIAVLDNWKGDVSYAKNWLVNHIKTVDFQYKGRI